MVISRVACGRIQQGTSCSAPSSFIIQANKRCRTAQGYAHIDDDKDNDDWDKISVLQKKDSKREHTVSSMRLIWDKQQSHLLLKLVHT